MRQPKKAHRRVRRAALARPWWCSTTTRNAPTHSAAPSTKPSRSPSPSARPTPTARCSTAPSTAASPSPSGTPASAASADAQLQPPRQSARRTLLGRGHEPDGCEELVERLGRDPHRFDLWVELRLRVNHAVDHEEAPPGPLSPLIRLRPVRLEDEGPIPVEEQVSRTHLGRRQVGDDFDVTWAWQAASCGRLPLALQPRRRLALERRHDAEVVRCETFPAPGPPTSPRSLVHPQDTLSTSAHTG